MTERKKIKKSCSNTERWMGLGGKGIVGNKNLGEFAKKLADPARCSGDVFVMGAQSSCLGKEVQIGVKGLGREDTGAACVSGESHEVSLLFSHQGMRRVTKRALFLSITFCPHALVPLP